MLSGRALALVVLAWSLIKVTLSRMFGAPTGLRLFHQNYDADRLPSVDPAERAAMPGFGRCIACGRCDVGEAERIERSRGAYPGVMRLVLSSSRSMPDFDAAVRALDHVSEEVLVRKEGVCPAGVPIAAIGRFVRAKAQVGETSVSRGAAAKAATWPLSSAT